MRSELAADSHILGIAQVNAMLGETDSSGRFQIESNSGAMESRQLAFMPASPEFARVMGLKIVQGRDFSQDQLTDDSTNALVNEALVREMRWTEPAGKRVKFGDQVGHVVGVVRDFNFKSLHTAIGPFALRLLNTDYSRIDIINRPFAIQKLVVNVSGQDIEQTLAHISSVVREADPRHPFEFEFLDAKLDQLYKDEHQLTRLMESLPVSASSLPAWDFSDWLHLPRNKGRARLAHARFWGEPAADNHAALQAHIAAVAVASVIASVIAYFAIDTWTAGFAYRAPVDYYIFVIAAAAAAAVAFLTIALQSWRGRDRGSRGGVAPRVTGSIDYHHGMLKTASCLTILSLLLCSACTTTGSVDEAEPVIVEESAPQEVLGTPEPADDPDAPEEEGEVPLAVAQSEVPDSSAPAAADELAEVVVLAPARHEVIHNLVAEAQALLRDVELQYVFTGSGKREVLRGRPVAFRALERVDFEMDHRPYRDSASAGEMEARWQAHAVHGPDAGNPGAAREGNRCRAIDVHVLPR